ncbi:MAG: hypothetical protein ACM3PP_09310 [Candidatus Saccharibacteria bacterium]
MQRFISTIEQGNKVISDMNDKMWETYMKNLDQSLEFSKNWSDMLSSSLDQSRDTHERFASMAGEAIKNLKSAQDTFQATYADMMKQMLENYKFKTLW